MSCSNKQLSLLLQIQANICEIPHELLLSSCQDVGQTGEANTPDAADASLACEMVIFSLTISFIDLLLRI